MDIKSDNDLIIERLKKISEMDINIIGQETTLFPNQLKMAVKGLNLYKSLIAEVAVLTVHEWLTESDNLNLERYEDMLRNNLKIEDEEIVKICEGGCDGCKNSDEENRLEEILENMKAIDEAIESGDADDKDIMRLEVKQEEMLNKFQEDAAKHKSREMNIGNAITLELKEYYRVLNNKTIDEKFRNQSGYKDKTYNSKDGFTLLKFIDGTWNLFHNYDLRFIGDSIAKQKDDEYYESLGFPQIKPRVEASK